MSAPGSESNVVENPRFPGISFGRSADGLPVARVDENAFAMAPSREGRYCLVTGWRIRRPMAEWTRGDFFGHCGELADEDAFRAQVLENAEHQRERIALGRREEQSRASTPWGPSQGATVYADGVVFHVTAGHGGFILSPGRNRKIHQSLRVNGAAYEEDEAWAIVAFSFPHLFTGFERRAAEKTMKDSFPDAWEAITAKVLGPGESRKKDERAFFAKHRNDWIAVSAIVSAHQPGFTEVIATPGGKRGPGSEERRFLLPSDEYRVGRFGFVVDPERHEVYGRPSSFVTWRGRSARCMDMMGGVGRPDAYRSACRCRRPSLVGLPGGFGCGLNRRLSPSRPLLRRGAAGTRRSRKAGPRPAQGPVQAGPACPQVDLARLAGSGP